MDSQNNIMTMGIMASLFLLMVVWWTGTSYGQEVHSKGPDSVPTQVAIDKKPSEKGKQSSSLAAPVYKPPRGIGAPGGRVGGGSRGPEQDSVALFALVPNHLGLTIQEQPTLFWYLSQPAPYRLVLTVNSEKLVKPILETTITSNPKQGIHSTPLANYNIWLELDTEYRWFVELAVDTDYPSKNIVAGGRIQRINPPEGLLEKLRNAEPAEVTAIYSEAGLWYDALASISDLIETSGTGNQYRKERKALLEQVDLMEVARAEEDLLIPGDSMYWNIPGFRSMFTNAAREGQAQE